MGGNGNEGKWGGEMGTGNGNGEMGTATILSKCEMGTATILSYFMCHNNYCFFGLPGEWSVDSM